MVNRILKEYRLYEKYLAVHFTDGTHDFFSIGGRDGDDEGVRILVIKKWDCDAKRVLCYSPTALEALGFITKEEGDAIRERADREYLDFQLNRERQEYERLKTKFEVKDSNNE